jgi:FkbM family methyltransferase
MRLRHVRRAVGQIVRLYRARALRDELLSYVTFFRPFGWDRRLGWLQLGGRRFAARGLDWVAVEEVALRGEYEFIRPLLAVAAPVVVDIGANIGMFSLFAFHVNPRASVDSFEPSPDTFALLDGNRRANPSLSWRCHHAAVHAADGTIGFDDRSASTARRVSRSLDAGTPVPSLGLRTVLARVAAPVTVLKIDVEGSEEAILVGNEDLLAAVDHLVVELHPDACRTDAVVETLARAFPHLHRVPGRDSGKPLLLATRTRVALPAWDAAPVARRTLLHAAG